MLLWSAVFGQFAGAEADRDVQVRRLPGHGKVEDISKAFGIGCYGIAWGGYKNGHKYTVGMKLKSLA
jgi:hypothetical protein